MLPSHNFVFVNDLQFNASFYQHVVVQRRVKNPVEPNVVVGITNYIDFGFELQTRVDDSQQANNINDSSFQIGASWQANKNFLIKGKVGPLSSSIALAFKSWWKPSFTLSVSVIVVGTRCKLKVMPINGNCNISICRYTSSLSTVSLNHHILRHLHNIHVTVSMPLTITNICIQLLETAQKGRQHLVLVSMSDGIYQRADPNFTMLTPSKEHLAEGIQWIIGERPLFESDVTSGNFSGVPKELRPLNKML
ncbi:hypothetical protein AAHA92_29686 [Salvia divinorum]|uniref:Uncharacterized protein n=1 Tax=Salvia divinorum TaxID=28513 RepID=A0ABD1FZ64_SALDI